MCGVARCRVARCRDAEQRRGDKKWRQKEDAERSGMAVCGSVAALALLT